MATVQVRHDHKRGCGWRQPGGKYLVSGKVCAECGRLPLPLERCPVCGHGIKPSWGWTWIKAAALFANHLCTNREKGYWDECVFCCLDHPPERAGLLWIGERFYRTELDYLGEARQYGVSRRISYVPRDFKIGETVVFLAHRYVEFGANFPIERKSGIFAAFVPEAIEYVVTGGETEDELEAMERRGFTLVRIERGGEGEEDAEREDTHTEPGVAGQDPVSQADRPIADDPVERGEADGDIVPKVPAADMA